MLGLGLGLHKGIVTLSPLQNLIKSSSFLITGDKATGVSGGVNAPFTNPWKDLKKVADVTLQGFAGTVNDGWVTEVVKGVGSEIPYSNLVVNGDFANGTTGWVGVGGSISLSNKIVSSIGSGSILYPEIIKQNSFTFSASARIAVKYKARVTNPNCASLRVWLSSTVGGTVSGVFISNPVQNQWYEGTIIITLPASGSGFTEVRLQHTYADSATANGKVMEIDGNYGVQVVNLSTNPDVLALESQLGRQLTTAECDYLFAFTPTSSTVKAKTVIGLKADGVDDVGIMGANAPNPTNNDFSFGFVIKTGANKVKYFAVRGDTSDATTQYGFKMDASGNLFVILNGTSIQIGTALTVGFHKIWLERVGTALKAEIDGVQTYSGAHSTTLTTRANTVLFASPTSGTTYTGFSNDTLCEYVYDNVDIPKGKIAFYKQVASQYGL